MHACDNNVPLIQMLFFYMFYMLLQYKLELKTNAQICVLHLFYLKIYIFLLNTCKIIYDTQLMLQE